VQSVIPGHAAFVALIREQRIAGKDAQASHQALIAGCGVNALSGLQSATFVGQIRRASFASGADCRMRRKRLIRPTVSNVC